MFDKLKVQTRLFTLLGFFAITLVFIGIFQFVTFNIVEKDVKEIFSEEMEGLNTLQTIVDTFQSEILLPSTELAAGILSPQKTIELIEHGKATIAEKSRLYFSTTPHFADEIKAKYLLQVDQASNSLSKVNEISNKIISAIESQNLENVNALTIKETIPFNQELRTNLNKLRSFYTDDMALDYQDAIGKIRTFEWAFLFIFIGILTLLVFLSYSIIKSIIHPLEYAVNHVDKLSIGDTSDNVEIFSGGELGHLLEALKNMKEALQKMSLTIVSLSQGDLTVNAEARSEKDELGHALVLKIGRLREMIRELKSEVNTLNSAAEELGHSTAQLSSGASETASSITETTSTLEELKQTSHNSVEKAKEVLSLAQDTLHAVSSSGESLGETIEDMHLIKERMQIISDSILKLSEKTIAIGAIMDTVNDIAEQSNLLSVNAAIEAAKAGEMGKSFSVVAAEIRHLAEQSKEATIQVKNLLTDIQNATNATVLATEQGNKAVIKGVDQSKTATQAMNALVDKMGFVTEAANQIVLSNEQQLLATGQISVAMSNINEATNQHVDQMGQIETVVDMMKKISTDLQNFCDQYRLPVEKTYNEPHPITKIQPKVVKKPELLSRR